MANPGLDDPKSNTLPSVGCNPVAHGERFVLQEMRGNGRGTLIDRGVLGRVNVYFPVRPYQRDVNVY